MGASFKIGCNLDLGLDHLQRSTLHASLRLSQVVRSSLLTMTNNQQWIRDELALRQLHQEFLNEMAEQNREEIRRLRSQLHPESNLQDCAHPDDVCDVDCIEEDEDANEAFFQAIPAMNREEMDRRWLQLHPECDLPNTDFTDSEFTDSVDSDDLVDELDVRNRVDQNLLESDEQEADWFDAFLRKWSEKLERDRLQLRREYDLPEVAINSEDDDSIDFEFEEMRAELYVLRKEIEQDGKVEDERDRRAFLSLLRFCQFLGLGEN
ncbi:hypothetical protein PRIPAC_85015 [Pristionchus pacificus]|uniref:Uncharacterized protein n=1 Tax=Pristionchus pacificus TaxID=54126 RepID=A0A2A6BNN9_PRIPA|nr:hypothetical protein PRIPAC_85015 [Pristionchus pacificus]|eukprot:PDM67524.1 hypothetical protein PRIPAC_48941 [Pristionchus pacificus]